VNFASSDGRAALHWASWHGHAHVVLPLIPAGADVHALD